MRFVGDIPDGALQVSYRQGGEVMTLPSRGHRDLKRLLKTVLEELDHKHLNEVPPFDVSNPSSENLARYIWQRMAPSLPDTVHLQGVTVAEKGIQSATYCER
ncbi:MAG: tRNA lysidine(34) synthetase TilS [Bilophila sp.]